MKYTPGPWHVADAPRLSEENERLKEQNAELLDALKGANNFIGAVAVYQHEELGVRRMTRRLDETIAKAEGKGTG